MRASAVAALMWVLLLSGCGDSSTKGKAPASDKAAGHARYEQSFQAATTRLQAIVRAHQHSSQEDQLRAFADGVLAEAKELQKINPPDEIRSAHKQMIITMLFESRQTAAAAAALHRGDVDGAKRLLDAPQSPAQARMYADAIATYKRLGYQIKPDAG